MATKSQSLLSQAIMIQKEVELPVATGTVAGPAVEAGTLVLAAGVELLDTNDSTDMDLKVTDGATDFMADTSIDALAAGSYVFGTQTQGVIAVADTIDATVTVTDAPSATSTARVWAIVVSVEEAPTGANEVDRDQLA